MKTKLIKWGIIMILVALIIILILQYAKRLVAWLYSKGYGSSVVWVERVAAVVLAVGWVLLAIGVAFLLPLWAGILLIAVALIAAATFVLSTWNKRAIAMSDASTAQQDYANSLAAERWRQERARRIADAKSGATTSASTVTSGTNQGRYFM